MGCTKSLSFDQPTLTTSLDAAVYDPVTGFIFGVRGQWLYKFSATDGSFQSVLRFTTNAFSPTCIATIAGKLYCGVMYTPIANLWDGSCADRDIFIVDAATFTVDGRFNLGSEAINLDGYVSGYRVLTSGAGLLCGYNFRSNSSPLSTDGMFSFDPTNVAPTFNRESSDIQDDICYDSFNDVFWSADPDGTDITVWSTDLNDLAWDNGGIDHARGITYNLAQNKVYVVQGDDSLLMVNAADAMPGFNDFDVHPFSMGRAASNAFRLKSCNDFASNAFNGKVLIPTWNDDAIVVWDPATDTVDSVKTGFTAPWDIVHAPTASFAIQNSEEGLKIIT